MKVCTPTANGGLGIIELERFSRALRLRWIWYSWDSRHRSWTGMELPVDKDDTALFNAATRVQIGNGNKATFWTSRWLQGEALATLYPSLFRHSRRKNRTVKEALTNERWIEDVNYSLTTSLITEFVSLWGRLQDIVLQPLQEDTITWLHSSDGQYTAKSAYELQFIGTTSSHTAEITWQTRAPPKCKFFVWLMLQNRIWTAARLQIRGWPNDYFCPFCVRNLETVLHLFQECFFSKIIWDLVGRWISAESLMPINWSQSNDLCSWFTALGNNAHT